MNRTPVASSSIKSIGHEGNTLEVEFANGGVYRYDGVTADDHAKLIGAESVGKHFQAAIKNGGFKVTKLGAGNAAR